MRSICFSSYRLDLDEQRLWSGEEEVTLRAKTFSVLCYLAERPGRLVSKEELLEALWPNTYVCDVAPMVCVWEIRKALGGLGQELIATVHRRGYRFVARVASDALAGSPQELASLHAPAGAGSPPAPRLEAEAGRRVSGRRQRPSGGRWTSRRAARSACRGWWMS